MRNIFFILFLFSFAFAACDKKGDESTFFPDAPANPDKVKLLQLVNAARQSGHTCGSNSLPAVNAVVWNDTLALVAKNHSKFMDDNDKLNHVGLNGSTVEQRIAESGYVAVFYNENLAKGGATEEEVIALWLNSTAHCENIMEANVQEMGVGTSGAYWTMVMAKH